MPPDVLLLTLRGTPFLYQGEELGLEDAVITPEARVDPGGRDGCRAPLPWEPEFPHGWSGQRTWLPFPPDASALCAARQWADERSTLHLYRRLLALRRGSAALRWGDWTELDSPPEVLAYRRTHGNDECVVLINFADREQLVPLPGAWRVALASDEAGESSRYGGRVAAEQAVVLEPAKE